MNLRETPEWNGPLSDPNDEQFGDIVELTTLDSADEFDAPLIGKSHDDAVIGRHGACKEPATFREVCVATKTHCFDGDSRRIARQSRTRRIAGENGSVDTAQEVVACALPSIATDGSSPQACEQSLTFSVVTRWRDND